MIRRALLVLVLALATLALTAAPASAHAGYGVPYCGHGTHRHYGVQVRTLAHTDDLRTGQHSHLLETRSWPFGSYRAVGWVGCGLNFVR